MRIDPVDIENVPRRVIASYPTYADAQAAVDMLADERFTVERLAIVGSDLRLVEQVTGRLDYPRVVLAGAASGAPIGALLGLLWSLFLPADAGVSVLAVLLYWLLAGAVAGAVVAVIGYALTRGRRDFASVQAMQAGRYDLMATEDVADEARSRLTQAGAISRWPEPSQSG
jgi:hypothetical protein